MLDLVNRDVIFSIKPKYADQIMEGIKTVELRRRFTNEAPIGARAFIYSSAPAKAMVGYATIADVRLLRIDEIWKQYGDQRVSRAPTSRRTSKGSLTGTLLHCVMRDASGAPLA